jgi:hypothetical protein
VTRRYACAAIKDKMMKAKVSKSIEEIMTGMKCPKNFRCADSGFERLCRAEDIELDNHLLCLEINPFQCNFSVVVEKKHFCTCPFCVYLSKK